MKEVTDKRTNTSNLKAANSFQNIQLKEQVMNIYLKDLRFHIKRTSDQ